MTKTLPFPSTATPDGANWNPPPRVLTVVYPPRRHNLLHRTITGDEDVAAPVHRQASGLAESAAQGLYRGRGRDASIDCQNLLYLFVGRIGDEEVPA